MDSSFICQRQVTFVKGFCSIISVLQEISCILRFSDSIYDHFAALGWIRYEGDEINARLADSEADILHDAIKDKEYNHEDFIRILTTRSRTQLMALLDEPAEEFKTILRTAIRCIYNHKKFYEKILRNSIRKFGTDEDALTRVIVTRAEKDLNDIKGAYLC
ncbi:hypothetical protein OIU76_017233 [Salix suchowensis]|nr:hypothetical protein OIU76_017233 [Salix suchowensis]